MLADFTHALNMPGGDILGTSLTESKPFAK